MMTIIDSGADAFVSMPLFERSYAPGEQPALHVRHVHVWRADASKHVNNVPAFRSLLDENEARRAARFRFQDDRNTYTVAHGLLRLVLSSYSQTPPESIRYGVGPYGKPHLAVPMGLHFNLSHSGDRILIAIARRDVGIDVEQHSSLIDCEALASSIFSAAERAEFGRISVDKRSAAFFTGWVRKEAYVKATGAGLHAELADFDVSLGTRAQIIADRSVAPGNWTIMDLRCDPEYAAAIVAHADVSGVKTFIMTPELPWSLGGPAH